MNKINQTNKQKTRIQPINSNKVQPTKIILILYIMTMMTIEEKKKKSYIGFIPGNSVEIQNPQKF